MRLYTVQMAKGRGDADLLDITVKGNHPVGKFFAPTWKMVNEVKKGIISIEHYSELYRCMMVLSYYNNKQVWHDVLTRKRVVLACFCPSGDFCHRNLLAGYLMKCGAIYKGEL